MANENANPKNLNCVECGRWNAIATIGSTVTLKCKNAQCRAEIRFEVTEAGVNCIVVVPSKRRKPHNADVPVKISDVRAGPKETK